MGSQLDDVFEEGIGEDQHLRGDVTKNIEQFLPVQAPVESRVNRTQLGTGEEQVQVFVTVFRQNRHAVVFIDALGFQPVGQFVRAPVGFAIGQPPFGRFARVDEGEFGGAVEFASA